MAFLIQPPMAQAYFDAKAAGAVPNSSNIYILFVDSVNGNDANPPSIQASPWKTFDKAMDFMSRGRIPGLANRWVLQVNPGNYTWANSTDQAPDAPVYGGIYVFSRDANPATAVITPAHSLRFGGSFWQFDSITFNAASAFTGNDVHQFRADLNTYLQFNQCVFNIHPLSHDLFNCASVGSLISIGDPTFNFPTVGMGVRSMAKIDNGSFYIGGVVTINNPPNFYEGTITLDDRAYCYVDPTISFVLTGTGTVTGKRYDVVEGSMLLTGGASITALPGTIAGTVDSTSVLGASA